MGLSAGNFFLIDFLSLGILFNSVILLLTYLHLYLNYSVLDEYNTRIRKQLRSVVDETKHLKLKLEDYKRQIRPDI